MVAMTVDSELLEQISANLKAPDAGVTASLIQQLDAMLTPEAQAEESIPIYFLRPRALYGTLGFQVLSARTRAVLRITKEDGTEVTDTCSYRWANMYDNDSEGLQAEEAAMAAAFAAEDAEQAQG